MTPAHMLHDPIPTDDVAPRPADTDYSERLPVGWGTNMTHQDRCWVGKKIFAKKGTLVAKLKNWWYPPELARSVFVGCSQSPAVL